MSKHPYDWIIHTLLCFIPIYFNWATWFVVVFVALGVEYEQWNYAGKPKLKDYFFKHVLGDLIADAIGVIGGLLLCR